MDEMMSQLDLPSGHKLRILLNSFYQKKEPLFEGFYVTIISGASWICPQGTSFESF